MKQCESGLISRRDNYQPTTPTNYFIVTLLREAILDFFHNTLIDARPGENALDIGCGEQPFRSELEKKGYAYMGFDVTQNKKQNVDVLGLIDRPLPDALKNRQFNILICTEVLEHVADWQQAFQNMYSLLAPGGKILITCPHMYNLHEEPHDYWRPTPYALNYFADRYGLKVVSQRRLGDSWDVLGTVLGSFKLKKIGGIGLKRKFIKILLRWIYNNLQSKRWQKDVAAQGSLYLSNFVVLEK